MYGYMSFTTTVASDSVSTRYATFEFVCQDVLSGVSHVCMRAFRCLRAYIPRILHVEPLTVAGPWPSHYKPYPFGDVGGKCECVCVCICERMCMDIFPSQPPLPVTVLLYGMLFSNSSVKTSGRASLVPSLCPRRVGHKLETKRISSVAAE